MKKSMVYGGVVCVVALAVIVGLMQGPAPAQERDRNKPEVLPGWPSGEYSIKLTDGSLIQTSKGIHVYSYKGITLMATTLGYPQKPETVFFNPDHVVTIKKINK